MLSHACGRPALVAVVERRDHLVADQPVELGRVAPVLRPVVVIDLAADGPAVGAVVGLGPPAVEHRELEARVDGRLHAARPARLQRRPRDVDPDVAAAGHGGAEAEVVVVEVDDAAGDLGVGLHGEQALDEPLAVVVARMRLAGEDHLDRAVPVAEQRDRAVDRAQQQVEALVGRDAAGEAERERIGIERLGGRAHVLERVAAPEAVGDAALAHELEQLAPLGAARRPQLLRRERCRRPPTSPGSSRDRPSPRRGGGRAARASARRSRSGCGRRW